MEQIKEIENIFMDTFSIQNKRLNHKMDRLVKNYSYDMILIDLKIMRC